MKEAGGSNQGGPGVELDLYPSKTVVEQQSGDPKVFKEHCFRHILFRDSIHTAYLIDM